MTTGLTVHIKTYSSWYRRRAQSYQVIFELSIKVITRVRPTAGTSLKMHTVFFFSAISTVKSCETPLTVTAGGSRLRNAPQTRR